MLVSSLTFSLGRMVNLIHGSDMRRTENPCQVIYPTASGFLFVRIFQKSGRVWAAIAVHGIVHVVNAVANEDRENDLANEYVVPVSIGITVFVGAYALWLQRRVLVGFKNGLRVKKCVRNRGFSRIDL